MALISTPALAQGFTGVERTSDGVWLRGGLVPWVSEPYVILYSSSDLNDWKEEARLHNATRIEYFVPSKAGDLRQFFRFEHIDPPPSDWSSQISVSSDPYASHSSELPFVKFVIKTDQPDKVYFTGNYLFHYDFVAARIEPFIGIPRDAFDNIARHNAGRELLLGAVLLPSNRTAEYGIQFESADPLPLDLVKQAFEAVRRRVVETRPEAVNQPLAFYVPTYEQAPSTLGNAPFFETNQIPVTTLERWLNSPAAYS